MTPPHRVCPARRKRRATASTLPHRPGAAAACAPPDDVVAPLVNLSDRLPAPALGRAVLRVLAARWLGLAPVDGRHFFLTTASVSILSYHHDLTEPVICLWNDIKP